MQQLDAVFKTIRFIDKIFIIIYNTEDEKQSVIGRLSGMYSASVA